LKYLFNISLYTSLCRKELVLLLLLIFLSNLSDAQTKGHAPVANASAGNATSSKPVTRILFVLDCSASMLNPWEGKTKIEVARSIINELEDSLKREANVETALRVYGHQTINTQNDCNDSKLEVAFGINRGNAIRDVLNNVRPKGITPLALSLEKAADDFPHESDSRNIVILVTDGEESCGGDPCAVSRKLQQQHIYLKPFVIGLSIDPSSASSMDCIGNYFNAEKPEALRQIMHTVIERILSSATITVNLLDAAGNPLETDVDMTFSDDVTGEVKYNFYHTLNYRSEPDTLQLDPAPAYSLMIHTIPAIEKNGLQFPAKKTEELNIPASQGYLKTELTSNTINNNFNSKIKCLIKKAGSDEVIMVQDLNTTLKYLSGNYDLEVLTLPRIEIKNVAVTQSSTTSVKVEVPGVLNLVKTYPLYGAIFITGKEGLVKIYELNENLNNELVGLQAGNYTVIYRTKSSRKTTESAVKTFQVKSGSSLQLRL
jgi:Ca-activated chloride channel family protein